MGRSQHSYHSRNYYDRSIIQPNDRPYYPDRQPYHNYTTERTVYSTSDRPGLYSSERQLYYTNGSGAPPRPPTEHSQVIVERKVSKQAYV